MQTNLTYMRTGPVLDVNSYKCEYIMELTLPKSRPFVPCRPIIVINLYVLFVWVVCVEKKKINTLRIRLKD